MLQLCRQIGIERVPKADQSAALDRFPDGFDVGEFHLTVDAEDGDWSLPPRQSPRSRAMFGRRPDS